MPFIVTNDFIEVYKNALDLNFYNNVFISCNFISRTRYSFNTAKNGLKPLHAVTYVRLSLPLENLARKIHQMKFFVVDYQVEYNGALFKLHKAKTTTFKIYQKRDNKNTKNGIFTASKPNTENAN